MADLKRLYKLAEEAFVKRNYDYARDLYLQIITTAPDESDARKLLRANLKRKYQEQGAPSRITQKIKLGTTSATLVVQKNPQSRMETVQKYLLEDPENVSMRVRLASALLDLGHKKGALAEAEIVREIDPKNGDAHKIIGRACIDLNRIPEAQAALVRAKDLKPEDRETDKLLKDVMARATMAKGFDEKKADYRTLIKDKDQAGELEKEGHLVKSDDDRRAHVEKLLEFHRTDPQDVKIIGKIGEAYAEMKDFASAKEWYEKACAAAPHDSALKDRVEDVDIRAYEAALAGMKAAGDPKAKALEAEKVAFEIKVFERRSADRPTDMQVRYELGRRYYAMGQLDKAIQEFQHAIKDPKRRLDSHIFLGMCFQRNKLYDLADKNYKSAEDLTFVEEKKIQIWYNWGRCCEEWGRAPQAMDLFNKIAEKDYNYRDTAQRLERLRAASGGG